MEKNFRHIVLRTLLKSLKPESLEMTGLKVNIKQKEWEEQKVLITYLLIPF